MCGIAGIINFSNKIIDKRILSEMGDTFKHRGPDSINYELVNNVGLVHARLKIIDLSEKGNQPMNNEDSTVLMVSNGEIYNYPELKKELKDKGHKFKSNTDIEVVIHLYEEYGEEFVDYLDGMYAIAIYDVIKEKIILVRDRMGIKPLFYYIDNQRLIFSSEIKPILKNSDIDKTIDYEGLNYYLTFNYIPFPNSAFSKIRQVAPSEIIVFSKNNINKKKYWDIHFEGDATIRNKNAVFEEFESLLNKAVNKRLMSDVPFGIFLSGGLDSSALACFMRKNYSGKIKAFSMGFKEKSFNELDDAKLVAKHLELDHEYEIIDNRFNLDDIIKIVSATGELFADSSILPFYSLSKYASSMVKMVLSGEGGDELLAGYETYQAYYIKKLYKFMPKLVRKYFITNAVNSIKPSYKRLTTEYKLKRFVRGVEYDWRRAHLFWRTIFYEEYKNRIFNKDIYNKLNDKTGYEYPLKFFKRSRENRINNLLEYDFKFYLPNDMLVKADRASMLNSLEVRVPFLDRELVEFLAKLPSNLKLNGFFKKKYILKKIMRGKIPKRVINKKKAGFNLPVNVWFYKELKKDLRDFFARDIFEKIGIFNWFFIEEMIEDHLSKRKDWGYQLWGLFIFVIWWNNVLNGR